MFNKFVITLTIFVMVMGVNAAKGKVGEKLDNKCQETIVKSKELAEARHESKGVLNSITGQFHRLANGAGFASCIHSSPKMIKEAFKKQWKGDNCKGKAADKFVEKITKDGKIQKVAAVTNFPIFLKDVGLCGAHAIHKKVTGKGKGDKHKKHDENNEDDIIYF